MGWSVLLYVCMWRFGWIMYVFHLVVRRWPMCSFFARAHTSIRKMNRAHSTHTQIDYYIITGVHAKELWNVLMALLLPLTTEYDTREERSREKILWHISICSSACHKIQTRILKAHTTSIKPMLLLSCFVLPYSRRHHITLRFYFIRSFALVRLFCRFSSFFCHWIFHFSFDLLRSDLIPSAGIDRV